MKNILLFILITLSLSAQAQRIVKNKTLKTTDLGNQKLEVSIADNDTVYVMFIKCGSVAKKYVTVELGNSKDALRILQFLLDADISGDDVINLENPSNNLVKKNSLGGYLVYSEGHAFSGQLRKPNIKGFIKAIHDFIK
jgi:hypothetical protein